MPQRPRKTKAIVFVVAAALLLRLGWGVSRGTDDAEIAVLADQKGYLELGRNLLRGDGLHYVDERFAQTVYATRTFGYPALVALCGGSVAAVRIVQAILDASTVLAVYLLARRLLGHGRAPLLASVFVAFNPFIVYFSALLLTETLYTSMLAWAMVLMLNRRAWVFGVLMLGLGIHVRPSGVGLPVALAVGAAFVRARQMDKPARRHAAVAAALGVVVTVAMLLPWAWRNDRVLGRWLWSTSNDGITAYDGLHPGATGASDQTFLKRMPHVIGMTELERSDYFAAEAKRFARENPGRVAWLTLVKVARTWSPVPLSDEFGRPLYRVIALLYALPVGVLVVVGILRGNVSRRAVIFLLLPAAYITAVHAVSVGSLRYRMPAEPALAVLAAAGAARLLFRQNEERTAPS